MSTTVTLNTITGAFVQEAEVINDLIGPQPDAVREIRRKAMEDFIAAGIPTNRHEEWKYLNLSSITSGGYKAVRPEETGVLTTTDARKYSLAGSDAIVFVIENGVLNPLLSDFSKLPEGLTIGTLSSLSGEPWVTEHLFRHAETVQEPFVALNTLLSIDPLVLMVAPKTKIETPVQLAIVAVPGADARMISPRILLVAGDHSECTIMESYHTHGNGVPTFTNVVSEVVIGEGARVHYTKVQQENKEAFQINYHKVNHASNSYAHLTTLTLGGALVRNNLNIRLDGQNIDSYLNGLYVLDGTQVVDNHTLVDHAMPHCHSNELYKGIIDDKAQGVFNGKIWVRPDAQKTNAYQSNKNLLLSNEASMNAKPQLEIYADDVKCSHGATTGQLDEEALFYLRARGIGEGVARALLNHAFAADVIEQIENETIRQQLLTLLEGKLTAMAAK